MLQSKNWVALTEKFSAETSLSGIAKMEKENLNSNSLSEKKISKYLELALLLFSESARGSLWYCKTPVKTSAWIEQTLRSVGITEKRAMHRYTYLHEVSVKAIPVLKAWRSRNDHMKRVIVMKQGSCTQNPTKTSYGRGKWSSWLTTYHWS